MRWLAELVDTIARRFGYPDYSDGTWTIDGPIQMVSMTDGDCWIVGAGVFGIEIFHYEVVR